MNRLIVFVGKICDVFAKAHAYYKNCSITKRLGGAE